MKKLINLIFPKFRKVFSEINGALEITYVDGKKVLDSENCNYSYGSLQRILKFGLRKIKLHTVRDVLLLGLGGGSVIETLREDFSFAGKITAVEIDPLIKELALHEFNLQHDPNLQVHVMDAFEFVKHTPDTYDLIIIDLYIDNKVPEQFFSEEFWKKNIQLNRPRGFILFNAAAQEGKETLVNQVMEFLRKQYVLQKFNQVGGHNTLILGEKRPA